MRNLDKINQSAAVVRGWQAMTSPYSCEYLDALAARNPSLVCGMTEEYWEARKDLVDLCAEGDDGVGDMDATVVCNGVLLVGASYVMEADEDVLWSAVVNDRGGFEVDLRSPSKWIGLPWQRAMLEEQRDSIARNLRDWLEFDEAECVPLADIAPRFAPSTVLPDNEELPPPPAEVLCIV